MVAVATDRPPYAAGAYGPKPASVLDEQDALEMAKELHGSFESDARKQNAFKRYQIWREDFVGLVVELITNRYHNQETRRALARHISIAENAALDITRKVCVVYREGVRRTIEGASKEQAKAFKDVTTESKIGRMAMKWHRMAFLLGPIIAIPVVTPSIKLKFETLLPHHYDIIPNPDDLMGTPRAAAWTVREGKRFGKRKAEIIVLDGAAWRYYDRVGGDWQLIDAVAHDVGEFPGSVLRVDEPFDDDWWMPTNNARVVSATLSIALIDTVMDFVRKSQSKKVLYAKGDLRTMAKGQAQDPEIPVMMDTGGDNSGPSDIEFGAIDLNTPVADFLAHKRDRKSGLVEAFGIPDYAVTFDGSGTSDGERLVVTHQGLNELRTEHSPFCRDFEHDLWPKAVKILRKAKHPLASKLPTDEKIREGFTLEIPKLARQFADPAQERDHYDWELSRGLTSELELMRIKNPSLDEKQAKERQEKFLDERAEFNDAVTKRNLSKDDREGVVTAAQANGQMGGKASGIVRTPPQGESDDSRDESGRGSDRDR